MSVISQAQDIQRELTAQINHDDAEWVMSLGQFDIRGTSQRLETIFDNDFKALEDRLSRDGHRESCQRMFKEINYLMEQALLRQDEKRKTTKTHIQFVLGRLIICRRMASQLLKRLEELISGLIQTGTPLFAENSISFSNLNTIFQMGNGIDKAKGCAREVQLIIEDYCHLLDLVYALLGDKRELYGTRVRADIYPFQIVAAIEQLFVSRTESCEAAALMIRSLLEVQVRSSIFSLKDNPEFIPKKSLDVSLILASCRRKDLRFRYSNETINAIVDNLNLVVHFGFKLTPEVLWYMFIIARDTKLVLETDESSLRQKIREVLEDLTTQGYVEKLDAPASQDKDLTIFWRY